VTVQTAEQRTGVTRRVAPLLASTGISVTGDGAFIAAAPLLAAALTSNPVGVSAVTAGFYIPWLVFGLPAGALVDRWPRRRVMVAADLARAGMLAGLIAAILAGAVSVPLLVAVVVCVGIAQCFFDPAAQAIIPAAVGRDKDVLAHVNGRYWALDTTGRALLGPPLGSASFALSRALPFAADAASFVASAALVRRLPAVRLAAVPREGVGAAIRNGLRHLFTSPDLRVLTLSMAAYNFAYNASIAIFVLYARDVLNVPAAWYGVLLTAAAVGGIVMGWRARPLTRSLSYRQMMAVASVAQGLAWTGIVAAANVWVTAVLLVLAGAGGSLSSIALGSARQALTPDALLGRVVSASRLFGLGGAGLGALAGGAVAAAYGLTAALVLSASILALGAILTWPYKRR
jgi:predicted MFS family arabinose efflux permease